MTARAARPTDPSSRGVSGVRPRYGRLAAAGSALVVTLVTLLGGIGVLPAGAGPAAAADRGASSDGSGDGSGDRAALSGAQVPGTTQGPSAEQAPASDAAATAREAAREEALPAASGQGRRVVFDMSDQRVWLVDGDGDVVSTYLVSGSVTDNLGPGTYEVYSQSRWAVGIDDSGVMQYFTRFTRGDNAAIGFHSIPTKHGKALQTRAQLGTPQSHGCIRQWLPDAKRLYRFAPVGTKVVVTA